jgi:hypothetical protein
LIDPLKEALAITTENKLAYNACFNFDAPQGFAILKDLARFCRANESTFNPDPRTHALLEGRREVWLRIQEHLQLTTEQIYALHPIKALGQRSSGISASQMNRES